MHRHAGHRCSAQLASGKAAASDRVPGCGRDIRFGSAIISANLAEATPVRLSVRSRKLRSIQTHRPFLVPAGSLAIWMTLEVNPAAYGGSECRCSDSPHPLFLWSEASHDNVVRLQLSPWRNNLPEVTFAFRIVKIMSTIVGETGADYVAVNAGLGQCVTRTATTLLLAFASLLPVRTRRCRYFRPDRQGRPGHG